MNVVSFGYLAYLHLEVHNRYPFIITSHDVACDLTDECEDLGQTIRVTLLLFLLWHPFDFAKTKNLRLNTAKRSKMLHMYWIFHKVLAS